MQKFRLFCDRLYSFLIGGLGIFLFIRGLIDLHTDVIDVNTAYCLVTVGAMLIALGDRMWSLATDNKDLRNALKEVKAELGKLCKEKQ